MTILFTTDQYQPNVNGIVTHILLLREELQKRGHRVLILTPKFGRRYKKEKDVFYLPSIPMPLRAKDLITIPFDPITERKLKKIQIDIVHNHLFLTGFLGMTIAEKKNIPTLATYHTFLRNYADWIVPWARSITHPTANWVAREYFGNHQVVIAPSEKAVDELRQAKVKAPIQHIYNGIQLQPFYDATPDIFLRTFHLEKAKPLVVIAGTLEAGKNVDLAIYTMTELIKKIPEVHLAIVGDGKQKKNLQRLIDALGMKKHITITGFVNKDLIASANKAADVVLFTSDTDTFPTVVIEAIAAGKPVVSVRDKAVEGLVRHGENGLMTNKNPIHIAKALSTILKNPDLSKSYGKKSLTLSQKFSIEKYVDELEKVYKKLL